MTATAHEHDDRDLDWPTIVAGLMIGLLGFLYAVGLRGGIYQREQYDCRFCDFPVRCKPGCEADTHTHETCADTFRAGVERGQQLADEPEDVDQDDVDELDEDDGGDRP